MLARVNILLPYTFTVPKQEKFQIYEYETEGYKVRFYPPKRSDIADRNIDAENITIDGNDAINVDVLCVDFVKEDFRREENSDYDPPLELIKNVVNDFLSRVRYVTNATHLKLIEFPYTDWRLRYLNDDETELKDETGFIKGRGMKKFKFSFIALNKEIWDDVHKIEPYQPLPVWKTLLLDAEAILPEIGPAVILTFTALEVFISKVLDDVALASDLDEDLWSWINVRGYMKDPSIEERYDFLCKYFIGKSLKEKSELWESFKHLRKARNSFAHDGVSRLGDELITVDRARDFIAKANEIIEFIKGELSDNLPWVEFKHRVELGFTYKLLGE